jgi:hypothetical protein
VGRRELIESLRAEGVRFVIIGGVAMVLRGSSRTTVDLDLCYERSKENLGLGMFDAVARHSSELAIYGSPALVLDLDGLELAKRAAARVKDLLDLAEIELIRKRS